MSLPLAQTLEVVYSLFLEKPFLKSGSYLFLNGKELSFNGLSSKQYCHTYQKGKKSSEPLSQIRFYFQ